MWLWLLSCRPEAPPAGDATAYGYPELAELDALIVENMVQARIPGLAAAVVVGEELVWANGYGWANVDEGAQATPQTFFLVASVSKVVTGTALVLASEEGALTLGQDVGELLGFQPANPQEPGAISSRQLLSHSSSIADNWDELEPLYVTGGDSELDLGAFLEDYLMPGGAYYSVWNWEDWGPGERMEYSNVGNALAGHVVEAATGESLPDYCAERIFDPVGMEGRWHLADLDEERVAHPTLWESGAWSVQEHYGFPDYPDGQLRASAEDMGTFLAAFMSAGIVSQGSVDEMLRIQDPELDDTQGLAWYHQDELVGHNGGEVGASTDMWWDGEMGFVLLMNGEESRRGPIDEIEEALLDAGAELSQ